MAINIIDGFFLGSGKAIDSRFSVENISERDSIVYKYDGLKVFVSSNRITYVWNANTVSWDVDNSGTSGSGQEGYVSRWSNSSTIGTSSIYATSSFVGINTTNPLSILQLNNGSSSPLSLNIQNDSGVVGYNWYYSSGDNRFSSSKKSTKLEMTNLTGLSVQVRATSSVSWTRFLEINNSSGYNFLRNSENGNFISGSVSVNPSSTSVEYTPFQLMSVEGTFRSNSSLYKKVTYLTYNGSSYSRQSGFYYDGTYIATQANASATTTYNIQNNENNVIVNSTSLTPGTLVLPTLPVNSTRETGRELVITLQGTSGSTMVISSATNIIGSAGSSISPILKVGETIVLIAYNNNTTTTQWKLMNYDTSVFSSGTQDDFIYYNSGTWTRENYTSHLISSLASLTNTQTIRIRTASGTVNSYLTLPSITSTTAATLGLQGGNQSGNRRLQISHFHTTGYSVIQNWGSGTGTDGSFLYIISNNSSTTAGGERVIIQTRELSIPGTGSSDPSGIGGSIQLAAKTAIDFISQTGAYYLGNRVDTGASTAILPTVRTGSTQMHYLLQDPSTGRIYRSSTTTNTI